MPARIPRNIFAMLNGWINDGILHISDAGVPTDGTSGTGVNKCGKGSTYIDVTNGVLYLNIGTSASPAWSRIGGGAFETEVSITNAQMVLLRATPVELVAAPGTGKILQFVAAQLIFDFTAAYTAGAGDDMAIRLNNAGTMTTVSDTIEATAFLTAAADTLTTARAKVDAIVSAANGVNKPLVLHNTGGAEFGGGNAANVVRVKTIYTVWDTGL